MRAATVLVSFVFVSLTGRAGGEEETQSLLRKLESENSAARDQAEEKILRRRKETIEGLIDVVRRGSQAEVSHGAMAMAIRLLGELRVEEAVGILVEKINYMPMFLTALMNEESFCIYALSRIGKPAADGCLEALAKGHEHPDLLAKVVGNVYGEELAYIVVERAAEGRKIPAERERLREALKYFKAPPPGPPTLPLAAAITLGVAGPVLGFILAALVFRRRRAA